MTDTHMTARLGKRPWLAMAFLAVLSLGATLFVAHRALTDASDIVVRGEGDVLMSTVVAELAEDGVPPTAPQLERTRTAHEPAGLLYLAVVDREGKPIAESGTPLMRDVALRPGQTSASGRRLRQAGPLFFGRRPRGERPTGPLAPGGFMGMPLVVIEFEPPVIARLHAHLTRISIVGAAAGAVLLAFAIAWARSAARLADVERKATREQRLVALGSMSSVMAHELRNPLASLKGHAQLLVEDLAELNEPKKKAKAERVVREAERLEVLTTSLLDFVRDGPMERTGVTPDELVERALEHLDKARVRVDLTCSPLQLFVDVARFSRALHNLLENALHASSENDPPIELRIAAAPTTSTPAPASRTNARHEVVIEVRDRGPGIAPGSESQIFEPFHTTRVRGTGLGLAVARRIAEQHDGTLHGENHPDGGALFRLRFVNQES